MSYLRRDEVDAREKYEPLYKYIDDYLNDQKTPFKINVFLDYFDEILYKDINELRKNIEQVIISLEAKDNIDTANKRLKEYIEKFHLSLINQKYQGKATRAIMAAKENR